MPSHPVPAAVRVTTLARGIARAYFGGVPNEVRYDLDRSSFLLVDLVQVLDEKDGPAPAGQPIIARGMARDILREEFFCGAPRYEYLSTLGRGGMGVVYRAHDMELDEDIAIKVLSLYCESAGDEAIVLARFKREISLNRKVKHPNVGRLHDFGMSGPHPYITMELIPGKDLAHLLSEVKKLPPDPAVSILRQIALGMSAAHQVGIVHRDLKPQNVMVDQNGAVAILDFGLARAAYAPGLTMDGMTVGTPHYMSPEQARGMPTDARSDIYSIGVIAFQMLTGNYLFTGDAPMAIAAAHVESPVPVEDLERAKVPLGLRAIVLTCLEKDPARRFGSAQDLASSLAQLGATVETRQTRPEIEAPHRPAETEPERPPMDLQFVADGVPFWSDAEWKKIDAPREADHTPMVPHLAHRARDPVRKPVVLVVDDEAGVRRLVSTYLAQHGCETLQAETGQEALELQTSRPADLVLMDVLMPGVDGFDATRILKSQKAFKELPIVLMSGLFDRSRLAFAIQSGATDFLHKPLDMKLLLAKVSELLALRGFTGVA